MLTPKQIAEKAKLSLSLVYALLNSGKLQGFRVGVRGRGKWLISEDDYARFLESCKQTGPPPGDDGQTYRFL